MGLLQGYFSERTMPKHNKLRFWSHTVHAAENAASNSRWFLSIIRTCAFLIFTPLLHKADNSRARESSNPTGEPFTAAGHAANRLVDAPTLDWAAQESNRNAAMRDSL